MLVIFFLVIIIGPFFVTISIILSDAKILNIATIVQPITAIAPKYSEDDTPLPSKQSPCQPQYSTDNRNNFQFYAILSGNQQTMKSNSLGTVTVVAVRGL